MTAPRDNMDEEMIDIINTDTQFADGDQQDLIHRRFLNCQTIGADKSE